MDRKSRTLLKKEATFTKKKRISSRIRGVRSKAEFQRPRQNDNVDGDVVDITNINRQLPALHLGQLQPKLRSLVGDRLMDTNLKRINTRTRILSPERALR
jgi:tRNA A37 threonylcarbamoyladenosine dehydratase